MKPRLPFLAILPIALCMLAWPARGATAELSPSTAAAFDRYVQATETRMDAELRTTDQFLWPDTLPAVERNLRLDALRRGALVMERMETRENGRV